jgi:curved DNA-binding protein CbpA
MRTAEEAFKRVGAAHNTLSDPNARAANDRQRRHPAMANE